MPSAEEGPALLPGETWYPRGKGSARTIVRAKATADGRELVYRTSRDEITVAARDFRLWIARLSASVGRSAPSLVGAR
jgi:hypothetical protein